MNLVLSGLSNVSMIFMLIFHLTYRKTFFISKIKIDLEDKIVKSIFRKGVEIFMTADISKNAQNVVLICS